MALGVLNNLSAIYAENNLNNTNSSLQTVLQQLSSGSRINSGADDAAGLSLVNGLQANSRALSQSATNATEGVGLLQVADGALSQVTTLLNRAMTLATEASNGTLNAAQEAAANQEYQSLLSEINNIGSTTTYNQNQVFNGAAAGVAIYTGDSSSNGASIDELYFARLTSASVGDSGGTVQQSTSGQFVDLSTDTAGALTTAATQADVIAGSLIFTITNPDNTTSTITTTANSLSGLHQRNQQGWHSRGHRQLHHRRGRRRRRSGGRRYGHSALQYECQCEHLDVGRRGTRPCLCRYHLDHHSASLFASNKSMTTMSYVTAGAMRNRPTSP